MINQSKNTHLMRSDIIKNGSIFTRQELVELIFNQVSQFIDETTIIGDFGSGYGAFLEKFNEYGKRCFGTESDEKSYELLIAEYPNLDIYHENSLLNVSRKKYSLSESDKLIIIGNPPYNDTTSIFKKGEKGKLVCDPDLKSRDFGISFLKAYAKLQADFICILHPLSYLIKKQNFLSLGFFKDNYKLISATIFSSKEFESIKKTNSEFPVVAALYKRDKQGMDFQYIRNFNFNIYKSTSSFVLNNILTIDGYINKYPTNHNSKNNDSNLSPRLQFYTLRDMNALMRNAGFVEGIISNGIDVNIDNLYQYAWLYFLKTNFKPCKNKFLYGNLSPLYTEMLENSDFKAAVVYYAFENCPLIGKFINKEKIKASYGPSVNQYNALFAELERLSNLFN